MASAKLLRPKLEIDISATETPDWLSLQCFTRNMNTTIELETLDDATACAPTAKIKSVTGQAIEIEARWSYGVAAWFNVVHELHEGGPYPFRYTFDGDATVSATNPQMTGTLNFPPIPFTPGAGLNQFMDSTVVLDIVTGGYDSMVFSAA